MISTRDLGKLPDVQRLRRLMQSMAMLDAILCPEWDGRYYSFNANWSRGEQMGSMRNGSGDDLFAIFNAAGCWLKGFAHETAMSPYSNHPPRLWPGILSSVPDDFAKCLREPAFKIEDTTFCIWRKRSDITWQRGEVTFPDSHSDPDGSEYLLSRFDGQPETYRDWAVDYYERNIDLQAVVHVYERKPLTGEIIAALNPELTPDELRADIKEIQYPV